MRKFRKLQLCRQVTPQDNRINCSIACDISDTFRCAIHFSLVAKSYCMHFRAMHEHAEMSNCPAKICAEIGSTFNLTQSTIDYCDVVWDGCSKTAQASLEVVHNNAARAILGAPYRSSATTLRNQLGWSTLTQRRKNHTAVWMYRCLRGHAPSYLQNTFLPSSEVHQLLHYTRQNSGVYMPRPRTSMLK